MGGNYMEFGKPQAGMNFNGSDKDSSMDYLKTRGMKGQEVRNYNGGSVESKLHTHNIGVTAYNGNPINEVYTPATSHKVPPADAIIRPQIEKKEGKPPADQEDLTK